MCYDIRKGGDTVKNKIKIFIISAIIITILALSIAAHFFNTASDIDTTSWTLTNDTYMVVPVIEDTVSFYVNDMDGRTVFHWGEEGGWRKWDFKSITLCEDNTILITTGDMGEQRLLFDGEVWAFED